MTPQVEILTRIMSRVRQSGDVVANPFYGATEGEIKAHFKEAEEVYADVFKQFISAWWQAGNRSNPPPLEWEVFAL